MSRARPQPWDGIETLVIAECFGPTYQGEGPSTGQAALFLRLSRCNLSCPSCDAPYTWDWSRFSPAAESRRFTVNELAKWAIGSSTKLVVITGGEPLLQQQSLVPLVTRLAEAGRRVEIETNGTLLPSAELLAAADLFIVSPKLTCFGAGMPSYQRINPGALEVFASSGRAVFLFVVTDPAEVDEISELERRFALRPIWVMPEGTAAEQLLPRLTWLSAAALTRGWHLSSRLQVLLRTP